MAGDVAARRLYSLSDFMELCLAHMVRGDRLRHR